MALALCSLRRSFSGFTPALPLALRPSFLSQITKRVVSLAGQWQLNLPLTRQKEQGAIGSGFDPMQIFNSRALFEQLHSSAALKIFPTPSPASLHPFYLPRAKPILSQINGVAAQLGGYEVSSSQFLGKIGATEFQRRLHKAKKALSKIKVALLKEMVLSNYYDQAAWSAFEKLNKIYDNGICSLILFTHFSMAEWTDEFTKNAELLEEALYYKKLEIAQQTFENLKNLLSLFTDFQPQLPPESQKLLAESSQRFATLRLALIKQAEPNKFSTTAFGRLGRL